MNTAINLLADLPAPTPERIAAARAAAGLSQEAATLLVGQAGRAKWSDYEAGRSPLQAVRWALFLLATGQHPTARVSAQPEAG